MNGFLDNVPRGFYETAQPAECHNASPAFVRGILMPRGDYEALNAQQRSALFVPPRWMLYGGPLPTRSVALQWSDYLFFWAIRQGLIWLPEGTPCIVQNRPLQLPWPPDSSFQWTWVREVEPPRRVVRVETAERTEYQWEGAV